MTRRLMVLVLAGAVVSAGGRVAGGGRSAGAARVAGRVTAFVRAVVLDGRGGTPIESGTVVVEGDRIEAVGPSDSVELPAGADVVDLRGKTLMPGLADMHVHLTGGWDGEAVELLGYRRYLNALLYAGVTTVLDTGNVTPFVTQMRDEVAAGRLVGPRIYCAGPLIDGPDPLWPPITYSVMSVEQIPRLVRQLKASRVDVIKAYAGLSVPMVWALAAEGRKQSLRVIVDQSWRNGSMELAAGGVAAFAHAPDFLLGGDEALAMLKQRGVMFISTLSVVESKARRRLQDLSFLDQPLIRNTAPPDFVADLRASKPSASWEGAPKQENERRFRQQAANLKRLGTPGFRSPRAPTRRTRACSRVKACTTNWSCSSRPASPRSRPSPPPRPTPPGSSTPPASGERSSLDGSPTSSWWRAAPTARSPTPGASSASSSAAAQSTGTASRSTRRPTPATVRWRRCPPRSDGTAGSVGAASSLSAHRPPDVGRSHAGRRQRASVSRIDSPIRRNTSR
jgi:hypothetical protein